MASKNLYIYILVMAGVTYLIRMLPLVLSRKEITNPFIRSFLYYVPYACLAAMTFPAIISAPQTENMPGMITSAAGCAGFVAALIAAYRRKSLVKVAAIACIAVFITEQGLLLL
ncbi:MAG: AzlD domain-containing protein [Blautia sp.]|nr:AzlD domain-containing protein [Blautia sp.]